MWSYNHTDELYHHGIKGQKWGVRRFETKSGHLTSAGKKRYDDYEYPDKKQMRSIQKNQTRTLKAGTTIQNISKTQLSANTKKANRIYGSYTTADKAKYLDMMANFQYDGHGYKNSFTVKKDIRIASEMDTAKTVLEMFRHDPKQVSADMAKAYKAVHAPIFDTKNSKFFYKKMSKISNNPSDKAMLKMGRNFVATVPMTTKTTDFANDFYTHMIGKGFDAILDSNDATNKFGGTQDPLLIFNMNKMGDAKSIKLTAKELDYYADYSTSKDIKNKNKNFNEVAT